jgi:hypothetical protein
MQLDRARILGRVRPRPTKELLAVFRTTAFMLKNEPR